MIYLYPSGDSFSVIFDKSALSVEEQGELIELESLPIGEGILKRDSDGTFYFEPFPDVVIPDPEPEVVPEMTEEEIRFTTLLNTEYLVIMSELQNMF